MSSSIRKKTMNVRVPPVRGRIKRRIFASVFRQVKRCLSKHIGGCINRKKQDFYPENSSSTI